MFRCKAKDGNIYTVEWQYIQKAWVPVVTICEAHLYPQPMIPKVLGLELTTDGPEVSITWIPDERFFTEVQIKNDDGEWIVLDLVEKGVGEL